MARRFLTCRFEQRFQSFSNALNARRKADQVVKRNAEQAKKAAKPKASLRAPDADDAYDDDDDAVPMPISARRVGESDVDYWASFPQIMHPEKANKLLSLGPDLMLWYLPPTQTQTQTTRAVLIPPPPSSRMTELYTEALSPGGDWPAAPECVSQWSTDALESASTSNILDAYMVKAFKRCDCVLKRKLRDPTKPTGEELVYPKTAESSIPKPCDHFTTFNLVRENLKDVKAHGGQSLLVAAAGCEPNSKKGREKLIAKIENLTCFKVCTMTPKEIEDKKNHGSVSTNESQVLHLVITETFNRRKNVIRGIVACNEESPSDDQEADAATAAHEAAEAAEAEKSVDASPVGGGGSPVGA